MKTILLYASYTDKFSYYDDWLDAFKTHGFFQAECCNVSDLKENNSLKKKIETADQIVLHHSMNADTLSYLKPFMNALKNRKGKLVSFVGNEVNLPAITIAEKINALRAIEPEIIATQLLQEAGNWLYQACKKSKVISLPHALNPNAFFSKIDLKNRKIDVGTRSARYGVYIGDQDRNNIIKFFKENANSLEILVDFDLVENSKQRFDRTQWALFLSSCKATVSTEAGSFYLEKDDQLVHKIRDFLIKKTEKIVLPHETMLRKLYRQLVPVMIRKKIVSALKDRLLEIHNLDEECDYNEIHKNFFLNASKCPVYAKAISSRYFDAIGTKTMNIMYPGRYNDIPVSGEHYFELKKDHSNVYELKQCLRDEVFMRHITDQAYDHVISQHTYTHRLDTLLNFL